MEKTLVWMTHSFRLDSRLTSKLSGPCTFVYYSPYYFAGTREKTLLNLCSKENLDAFYESLDTFDKQLKVNQNRLYVFKQSNVIEHINFLIKKYGFTKVVIDLPLFGLWQSIDPMEIDAPYELVDSDLIDDECFKMTAKSRWMTHVKNLETEKLYWFNSKITRFSIDEPIESYPAYKKNNLINGPNVLQRALGIRKTYKETRDKHSGQTRLSTSFQNGVLDPHNVFFQIANEFKNEGADFTINDGPHASMLRQFAFREMTIIQARRSGLTMENSPEDWAKTFLTQASYDNLINKVNPESRLGFHHIQTAKTGDVLIDKILKESYKIGVMPNRARMFFAGWLFYNAPSGIDALKWLMGTFDLFLLDGQCPTNYVQCCQAMNMQYGKVMLLNRNNVENLLSY
jgi:deoxyribodipyrimidine photolyase